MSPHGNVFLSAFLLGVAGKTLFPQSSIRVALGAACTVIVAITVYLGDRPSDLGLALVAMGSLIAAGLGVLGAKVLDWLLRRSGLDRSSH